MRPSRPSLALLGAEPFWAAMELASHRLTSYGTAERRLPPTASLCLHAYARHFLQRDEPPALVATLFSQSTKENVMTELKNTYMKDNDKSNGTSHPVATGVSAVVGGAAGGIAGGAAAGAAIGGMTGPVGVAVGAVVGAVAGALAGKGIANAVDPVAEDAYWRDNHATRPYASGSDYDEYRPAYRYGVDAHTRYPDRAFDEVEPELSRDWNSKRGSSSLEWDRARNATRDAWQRVSDSVERATPFDSDRDGK